jgi:hypothetical protein
MARLLFSPDEKRRVSGAERFRHEVSEKDRVSHAGALHFRRKVAGE